MITNSEFYITLGIENDYQSYKNYTPVAIFPQLIH